MKYTRWLLYGAFLALTSTCLAQRGSDWRVFKAADGLPETIASAISVGPHGHLWVRHPDVEWIGWLSGYDIKAIPSPGPGNSHIYESTSGQLWNFTPDGLAQYDKNTATWIHYDIPEITAELRRHNPRPLRPLPIAPFKQNHVVMLFHDSLMDCNLEDTNRPQLLIIRAVGDTGLQKFSTVAPANDGGLWVIGTGGIAKIPGPIRNLKPDTKWDEYPLPEQRRFYNPREPIENGDRGLTVLADSSENGPQVISYFDGHQWSFQPVTGEKLSQAWRDGDEFWATTFNSLYRIKRGEKQLIADEEISAHRFYDVVVQTNGVFWLATSDGLFRHAPVAWRTPQNDATANSPVFALVENPESSLWAATPGSLRRFQNNAWTNYLFPPEMRSNATEIRSLFVPTNGLILLQTDDHLFQFNPQDYKFTDQTEAHSSQLKVLGFLKDGTLCVQKNVGANGEPAELAVYDGVHVNAFPYPQPNINSSSNLLFFVASQNDDLWLGGDKGLVWFHDKKWQAFADAPSSIAAPSCLLEVGDGKIWCGINDKIVQFDGKIWTAVHAGFFHVNSLFKSRDGSIWVASENGLYRFFHDTWIGNGAEEGVPSPTVRQVYEDHHGRIWAATARGLALYHPDADEDPPRTYVQNLPTPNNSAPEGSIVTFFFDAQDKWKHTSVDRLVYSYRMDGLEWSPYQEQRSASFLDLPAGKHIFRVRSMDRNWNVDPRPAQLEFAITVPWYRESRLIFISGAGAAVAIFFASLAFNRHRQLLRSYAEVEAKVAIRTKQLDLANQELFHSQKMNALGTLAAGIAHDFNNILSIIKGSAQIIEDNLENQNKIRTRTDRIKTVVEQGAGIVQAMLGFSRNSDRQLAPCNVNAIARDTITLLGDRFLREVEVKFEPAEPAPPEVPASREFLQQILLNFIFNAAEASTGHRQIILGTAHSSRLPVSLALKPAVAENYVFISVKDFGGGIAPEIMPRIFEPFFTTKSLSVRRGTGLGLSMAYELARRMDCGLAVESAAGRGSTFTLIIPQLTLAEEKLPRTESQEPPAID